MIGDDLTAALPELQAQAESMMTATCEIRGDETDSEADEGTGVITKTPGALHYSGKCRVRRVNRGREESSGEQAVTENDYLITIPVSADPIPTGSTVTIIASADPQLTGQQFAVDDIGHGSMRIQRNLHCTAL